MNNYPLNPSVQLLAKLGSIATRQICVTGGVEVTDAELAEYLHLTPDQAAIVIPKLSPAKRALYEHMKQVEIDAELWAAGLGPKPRGVLIDTERSTKRRKGWR